MKKYLISLLFLPLIAALSAVLSLYFKMVSVGIFVFFTGFTIIYSVTAILLYKNSKKLLKAQQQIKESQERIHGEISAPISTILGINEVIQKNSPSELGHYISVIDSAAKKILQAVSLQAPEKNEMDSFTAPKARILIAHESSLLQETIRSFLKNSEIQIEVTLSIKDTLERLSVKSFDLILMDCKINLKELYQIFPDFRTPIIALCTHDKQFSQTNLQFQGFTDTLQLPFSDFQLKKQVLKYLSNNLIVTNSKTLSKSYFKEFSLSEAHSKEINSRHLFSKKESAHPKHSASKIKGRIWKALFNERISIQNRTINLTLIILGFFGLLSTIITLINTGTEHYYTFLVNTGLILCILLCLYISIVKKNPGIAGFLCVLIANLIGFPIMYFSAGGLFSGMPIWLAFALLLPFMVLWGESAYVAYCVSAFILAGCCVVDYLVPGLARNVYGGNPEGFLIDILQSMIFTSFVFGLLSQYRFFIHDKYAKRIEENYHRLDKSNNQLKEANQAKDALIFNVQQYINEPLANITHQCQNILKNTTDINVINCVNSVKDDCDDLTDFSNNIQDFVNFDKDLTPIVKEPYSVKNVLQNIVQHATKATQKKNLEFKTDFPQSIPSLFLGDGPHLNQVLKTIITNAIKYTDSGFVKLSLQYESLGDRNGQMTFFVEDSGIGMRPEDVQRIQLNENQGFGLLLSSKILEKMHSKLFVKSIYNKGSEFSFKLISPICDSKPVNLL